MPPLETAELDAVYALPYQRTYHPCYASMGGVPAIEEVEFSITHNRGCFGACNFALSPSIRGRAVTARSEASVLQEAKQLTQSQRFKGYIHDVGGPSANFRHPSCESSAGDGLCPGKKCLAPAPCPSLRPTTGNTSQSCESYSASRGEACVHPLRIRYDYLLEDPDETFFRELVKYHVSGQLKVAPEHCASTVLDKMGKPHIEAYLRFQKRFFELTKAAGRSNILYRI